MATSVNRALKDRHKYARIRRRGRADLGADDDLREERVPRAHEDEKRRRIEESKRHASGDHGLPSGRGFTHGEPHEVGVREDPERLETHLPGAPPEPADRKALGSKKKGLKRWLTRAVETGFRLRNRPDRP